MSKLIFERKTERERQRTGTSRRFRSGFRVCFRPPLLLLLLLLLLSPIERRELFLYFPALVRFFTHPGGSSIQRFESRLTHARAHTHTHTYTHVHTRTHTRTHTHKLKQRPVGGSYHRFRSRSRNSSHPTISCHNKHGGNDLKINTYIYIYIYVYVYVY